MSLATGTRLGPYEILAPLGAGGMGEVYRARDTRLSREVAIKVLPSDVADSPDRLRRFEKEAQAASALNHPNIVTVYDIGTADSVSYIAMELVAGKTLREMLAAGPLPVRKLLGIAPQIADGLARAHASGIVHRDLKPENVMVTEDGLVKILDFGLAKLAQPELESDLPTQAPTVSEGTRPGVVLGTVGYMSPEQASGHPVDFHSDQFSFGSILYEMATGKPPFRRATAAQTLAAIIEDDPEPIATQNPGIPVPLRWTVERCLSKEPKDRYDSTSDLARDLQTLGGHLSEMTSSGALALAGELTSPSRLARIWPLVAIPLALAVAVFVSFRAGQRNAGKPFPTFQRLTYRRGTVSSARFASDGQTILYGAAWEGQPIRLFSTRAESPESSPLGLPAADLLAVSARGEVALCLRPGRGMGIDTRRGTLARVPLMGGTPREILEGVEGADWSPDGDELAVIRWTGSRRRLEFPVGKVLYEADKIFFPRVSPKGDLVAFFEQDEKGRRLRVADRKGAVKTLDPEAWGLSPAWRPDGQEIWYSSVQTFSQILAVSLSGKKRTVLAALPDPMFAQVQDIYRDGRVLLWLGEFRRAMVAVSPGQSGERDISWFGDSDPADISPDGRTVLFTDDNRVFVRSTDGGSPAVQLGRGSSLALSPDGKWAAAYSQERGIQSREITLLPSGAGEPRVLKSEGVLFSGGGSFSPDGKRLLLLGRQPGRPLRTFVQDVGGGTPRPFTPEGMLASGFSPDGKSILARDHEGQVLLLSADGSSSHALPGPPESSDDVNWSSDGRFLLVIEHSPSSARLFRREIATGRREFWKEISASDPAGVIVFSPLLARDGKSYVAACWRNLNSLYLVEGLK
jgi:Tol biopolymer transport system component